MSSLTQMGASPPGWRLQKHHTQKYFPFTWHAQAPPHNSQLAVLSHRYMATPQRHTHILYLYSPD